MTYEEFLRKIVFETKHDDQFNRVLKYEYKPEERILIEKLKELGFIENVTFMGRCYAGFDITYEGLHYFDKTN